LIFGKQSYIIIIIICVWASRDGEGRLQISILIWQNGLFLISSCIEKDFYTICEKDIYSICLGVKDGTLEIHQRYSGFLLSGYCFIGQRTKDCNCQVWVMHIFCKEICLISSHNVTMIALTSDICCEQIFYIFGIICQSSY
jgi:hypothetical protein